MTEIDEKTGGPVLVMPSNLPSCIFWDKVWDEWCFALEEDNEYGLIENGIYGWNRKPFRLIIGLLLADAWEQYAYSLDQAKFSEDWEQRHEAWDHAKEWKTWAHASEHDDRHLRMKG